ncbi:MAG: glycosyltransferase involved in cell wall biosynthesis [Halieaceae bacterium]|jgi:glycosyltransferase involved in cell wall biosynthesis
MSANKPSKICPQIGIVIPCFNEAQTLPITMEKLGCELSALISQGLVAPDSQIYFVDDGSSDTSWELIHGFIEKGLPVVGIKLTRNYGHQHALLAGLMEARGDALISMDADLQDEISLINEMLAAFSRGCEIVYAVRRDRSSDSRFKRWTAQLHYWLMEKMGVETVANHADYRLMSRRAVKLLSQYRETNLYLRGIIPHLGLRTAEVFFDRNERAAGHTKYTFWAMFNLAIKGITSFSVAPLRFISIMGFLIFTLSLILGGWVLFAVILGDGTVPGWASTVLPMYLLGGFQLLAIGIVGEYLGKSYMEVKRRPLYLVEEILGDSED